MKMLAGHFLCFIALPPTPKSLTYVLLLDLERGTQDLTLAVIKL